MVQKKISHLIDNIFFAAIRFTSEHRLCYKQLGFFYPSWLLSAWFRVTMGIFAAVSWAVLSKAIAHFSAHYKKSHEISNLPGKAEAANGSTLMQ